MTRLILQLIVYLHSTVHNAALMHIGPTPSITRDLFSEVFDTNVSGPYFLTQAALPYIPSGGRIILISSTSARLATVGASMSLYSASKAAVESLARSWAYEVCTNLQTPSQPKFCELLVNGDI